MTNSESMNTTSHLPTGTRLWPLKRYTEMHRRSLEDIEGLNMTPAEKQLLIEEFEYKEPDEK